MLRTLIMVAICFGLFSLTACSPPVRAVPEEALVAYYPLNEGTGDRARDLSGNGNNGKIMGAQWTKLGKQHALQFDGIDDHIFCGDPAALDIRGPFTLSVWVLPEEVPTGEVGIAGKQFTSYLLTYYKTGKIYTYIGEGANNVESYSYVLAVGTWNHIVSTFDGEKMCLYLNAQLVGQRLPKYNKYKTPPAGKNFLIGCVAGDLEADDPNYTQSGFFKGMIADVKVYARALSGEEIQGQFASAGKQRFKAGEAGVRPIKAVETISGDELATQATQKQIRKLEEAERITAVRGDGYFPRLIRLTNGILAAVVRGGARHMGPGGRLDLITSRDGGRNWSRPRPIVYMPPESGGSAFGQAADGRLICAFRVTGPYRGGQFVFETNRYTVWLTTSDDNGDSWTRPRQYKTAPFQYATPWGKIVLLPDGALLMALCGWWQPEHEGGELPQDKEGYFAAVCRSEDNGATWGPPIPIVGYIPGRRKNTNYNEVALVVLSGGKVLAAMRGGPWDGVDQCISSDGGRTWGPIESIIRGSQRQPANVILLKSGRLLLTFGHRAPPFGVQAVLSHKDAQWDQLAGPAPTPRPEVPSRKAGQWDWQTHVALEWNAADADCGYPSSVQLDDGTIVTLYYVVGERSKPDDISERGYGLMEYTKCVRYREADLLAVTTTRDAGSK